MFPSTTHSDYIAPPIYCTGRKPSLFKMRLHKVTKNSELFCLINRLVFPSLAGGAFLVNYAYWQLCQDDDTFPTQWVDQPIIKPLSVITFFTALPALYATACHVASWYCHFTKPNDENYHLYLLSLFNATMHSRNIELLRNTHRKKTLCSPIFQAGMDAFILVAAKKYLEKTNPDIATLCELIDYATVPTHNAVCQIGIKKIRGIDAQFTGQLIYKIMFYNHSLNQSTHKDVVSNARAHLFKSCADSELALANHERSLDLRTELLNVGLGIVASLVIGFSDEEINAKIERVKTYIENIFYSTQKVMQPHLYHEAVYELALFYIKHADYRDLDKALALLPCVPDSQKQELLSIMQKDSREWDACSKNNRTLDKILRKIENSPEKGTQKNLKIAEFSYQAKRMYEMAQARLKQLNQSMISLRADLNTTIEELTAMAEEIKRVILLAESLLSNKKTIISKL